MVATGKKVKTKKKVKASKVGKEKPAKGDMISEMAKEFEFQVMSDEAKDTTPYYIPFRHRGLQYITGGVPGGRFTAIEGDSQCGKSFLLYELIAECLSMGGYSLLIDAENAFEPRFGKRVGIVGNGQFIYTSSEVQLERIFRMFKKFVLTIRKKNKTAPILLGLDSYPASQIKAALDELNKENFKELKGYIQAKKNAVLSELLSEFINFIGKHKVAFVMVNQIRVKMNVMFGDPTTSNAENIIKFYATLRLRGRLGKKIKTEVTNKSEQKPRQIGVTSVWETIKNRNIDPFKVVETRIVYKSGVQPYSGLRELLIDEGKIEPLPKKGFKFNGTDYSGSDMKTFLKNNESILQHTN